MRLAGDRLINDLDNAATVLAAIKKYGNDPSTWPSIKDAKPIPEPKYKYDEHMKQIVPNIPRV